MGGGNWRVALVLFCVVIASSKCEVLWGTFNPGSLFSLRGAVPNSPSVGIAWGRRDRPSGLRSGVGDPSGPTYFRYHDGSSFAKEVVNDGEIGVVVTATWVLVDGSTWVLRINGDALTEKRKRDVNLFVYTTILHDDLEGPESVGELELDIDSGEYAAISAKDSVIGPFRVEIREPNHGQIPKVRKSRSGRTDASTDASRFHYAAFAYKAPHRPDVALKYLLEANFLSRKDKEENKADLIPFLPDRRTGKCNIVLVQRLLRTPFELDVDFGTGLTGEEITELIERRRKGFEERFLVTFGLERKGFSAKSVEFAQRTMSCLLGGIGFLHGSLPIAVKDEQGMETTKQSEVKSLFSATPSRRSFPRGFLWDEGFHQMLIQRWDPELSKSMLRTWLDTMSPEGWIPREQTRGADAVSRFPAHIPHFMIQNPSLVNPPTLLMSIQALRMTESVEVESDGSIHHSPFIDYAFEKLHKHVLFLASSQEGSTPNTFYWRGRSESDGTVHTLASGLDDYPRATNVSENEKHLDLTCWISWAMKTVASLAPAEKQEVANSLRYVASGIWSSAPEEHAALAPSELLCDYGSEGPACHEGYVSLFPLLLGLEDPASERVGAMLELMRDKNRLWSVGGLRSLSKSDPEYGKKDGYWTGPVWLPINYLALAALKTKYAREEGPYRLRAEEIYSQLRSNLISNVELEFERTGTVWEQYHAETGRGQRGEDFTGWTSLIVLIMAEIYDGVIV